MARMVSCNHSSRPQTRQRPCLCRGSSQRPGSAQDCSDLVSPAGWRMSRAPQLSLCMHGLCTYGRRIPVSGLVGGVAALGCQRPRRGIGALVARSSMRGVALRNVLPRGIGSVRRGAFAIMPPRGRVTLLASDDTFSQGRADSRIPLPHRRGVIFARSARGGGLGRAKALRTQDLGERSGSGQS